MWCLLKDDIDGTFYIARKQDVESGEVFFTDGRDYFLLQDDEFLQGDEYQDKSLEKTGARLSFNEMVVLACLLGLVFFWLPVGFLLWWFLG